MNIHQQIANLQGEIASLLAEFPELASDSALRADMIEGSTSIADVAGLLLGEIQDVGTLHDAIDMRINQLSERQDRLTLKMSKLREMLVSVMDRAGVKKLTLPEATLSVSYRKPLPVVTDETALPENCVEYVRKPAKEVIKEYVEAGVIPPGVSMSNGKSVLTIRTK